MLVPASLCHGSSTPARGSIIHMRVVPAWLVVLPVAWSPACQGPIAKVDMEAFGSSVPSGGRRWSTPMVASNRKKKEGDVPAGKNQGRAEEKVRRRRIRLEEKGGRSVEDKDAAVGRKKRWRRLIHLNRVAHARPAQNAAGPPASIVSLNSNTK